VGSERISIEELRGTVRAFVDREVAPRAAEIDREDTFPRWLWPKLGELGILGPTVPEADGGGGLGFLEHLVCVEELSRGSASVGLSYAAHSNLCISRAPAFVVRMMTTLRKSALRPLLSVSVAWSITWRSRLNTSGCAFSISSRRRTAYGVLRIASVRSPPWSKPT
jgi:alkylation response protein AidB-like acyl-CoA dehydrogenase